MSNENMTLYFLFLKDCTKPHLKVKEVREELAAYFLSGGRIEWQNDCA
jgi:hypothetical protein